MWRAAAGDGTGPCRCLPAAPSPTAPRWRLQQQRGSTAPKSRRRSSLHRQSCLKMDAEPSPIPRGPQSKATSCQARLEAGRRAPGFALENVLPCLAQRPRRDRRRRILGLSTEQQCFPSAFSSSPAWYFLANSASPLDAVQVIYKSNFWNECPTPFRLGLDRRGLEEEERQTDHSSRSSADDKLGRIWGARVACC